ncbi:MAG TPA: signal peptidase I, partial [Thermoanaerobaculia bacterium]|nr:signal peptidase I [Thermoanaerobaculia bacterium]
MDQEHELRRSQRRAWIVAVCIVVPGVLLFVCLRFLVATPRVPTKAMSPTVHARDRVVVNNLAYLFDEPRVGDVVAYRDRYGHLYRIVAGPGDTIQMRDNVLFLNGKRRHEPYIQLTPDVAAVRTFGPVT